VIAEDLREIADVESCGEATRQTADRPSRRRSCTSSPLTGLKIEHVRRGVIAAPGVARLRGQASRLWLAERDDQRTRASRQVRPLIIRLPASNR
jgi:hypothetical protein